MTTLRVNFTMSVLGLAAIAACGNSSSKSDAVAVCQKNCAKSFDLCLADGGALISSFKGMCEMACTSRTTNTTACTNASAIVAAINGCQSETTCAGYTTCMAGVPACTGGGTGSGTGGSGGSAGSAGTSGIGTGGTTETGSGGASGGSGGSGGSATCDDLSVCCGKVTDPFVKQVCGLQLSTVQSMVTNGTITQVDADRGCAQALTISKATYCP